jgi:hypothetical protein
MVLMDTLVATETKPETVAPWPGAVMEIVGGVAEDKLPFFEPALVRPTHPVHSADSMNMRKKPQRLLNRVVTFPVGRVPNVFI